MSLLLSAVGEAVSGVEDGEIVDKLNISFLEVKPQSMFLGEKM
jgi:hypothetical protein